MYYRNSAAAIIVFDVTRRSSFDTVKTWVKELRTMGSEHTVIAIAGNKIDLEDQREVATEDASAYAEEIGALYVETSAKSAHNVQDLFVRLTKCLPPVSRGQPSRPGQTVTIVPAGRKATTTATKSGCCS
jgi:GTPase SAR1 family protein